MPRHFTAGNLNQQDKKSFAFNLTREMNGYQFDEDLELMESKERARNFEEMKVNLRDRSLIDFAAHLSALSPTGTDTFASNFTLESQMKFYEEDFETMYKSVTDGVSRKSILEYTAKLLNSLIQLKHRTPTMLRLVKRLAIRLGMNQYTKHI